MVNICGLKKKCLVFKKFVTVKMDNSHNFFVTLVILNLYGCKLTSCLSTALHMLVQDEVKLF